MIILKFINRYTGMCIRVAGALLATLIKILNLRHVFTETYFYKSYAAILSQFNSSR